MLCGRLLRLFKTCVQFGRKTLFYISFVFIIYYTCSTTLNVRLLCLQAREWTLNRILHIQNQEFPSIIITAAHKLDNVQMSFYLNASFHSQSHQFEWIINHSWETLNLQSSLCVPFAELWFGQLSPTATLKTDNLLRNVKLGTKKIFMKEKKNTLKNIHKFFTARAQFVQEFSWIRWFQLNNAPAVTSFTPIFVSPSVFLPWQHITLIVVIWNTAVGCKVNINTESGFSLKF